MFNKEKQRPLVCLVLVLIPLSFLGTRTSFFPIAITDFISNIVGKLSYYAHLGGLLSGIALAFIYAFLKQLPPIKFTYVNKIN